MAETEEDQPNLNVSRETRQRLALHETYLRKWNPAINLVSAASLSSYSTRHLADSAQLLDLAPAEARHWVDIGSGGGFPGLVIAIIAQDRRPDLHVTLIESDQRKASFLMTVLRETGVEADVIAQRAEIVAPCAADIVSARAVAPLPRLLGLASRHLQPSGRALLPKGRVVADEIAAALEEWCFTLHKIPSETDDSGVILSIGDLTRA